MILSLHLYLFGIYKIGNLPTPFMKSIAMLFTILYLSVQVSNFKEIICIILIPMAVGLVSGLVTSKEYVYRIMKKMKLNPIHPTPTAWEDCFSDTDEQFILVRLKNGNQFGGKLNTECFISSDVENQDIYISEIYEIDDQNQWNKQDRGVYISRGEISSIEFIPIGNEEDSNV